MGEENNLETNNIPKIKEQKEQPIQTGSNKRVARKNWKNLQKIVEIKEQTHQWFRQGTSHNKKVTQWRPY